MTFNSIKADGGRRLGAQWVQRVLEQRVEHGDYQGTQFPTERELAEELGVSRMTARKAVQALVDRALLARLANGRVSAAPAAGRTLQVVYLVPTLSSSDIERWRLGLERVRPDFAASIRTTLYLHWHDPAIVEALESFDGVFLTPSCEPMPQWLIEQARRPGKRLVVLGRDLSPDGIASVDLFPRVFVQRLLDHLAGLGHRSVDCFNVQTFDPVIEQRVEQWNLWRAAHRFGGRLLGRAIEPYDDPLASAYEQAHGLLEAGLPEAPAVLCTTAPAAIGLVRAMRDRGLTPGRDRSVCVVNDEGLARYLSPSITSVVMPAPDAYLSVAMDWMRRGKSAGDGGAWIGPLLLQPAQAQLFIGESTGPGPAAGG